MSTLLLRLAAPLQAWGADSKFDTRSTEKEPTQSGVLGLLAAALGIRRDDTGALKALSGLRFGVRVDREGQLLHDFHTAHSVKSAYVTHRYYLCDAVFLCGLESQDTALLRRYAEALTHPVFPLFLGRRSCPPTLPLVWGIREEPLEQALKEEPALIDDADMTRIMIESSSAADALIRDVPVSFSPYRREFGFRRQREELLEKKSGQTEHDAFAELEAEECT